MRIITLPIMNKGKVEIMRLRYFAFSFVIGCLFSCLGNSVFSQQAFRRQDRQTELIPSTIEEVPYAFAVGDRLHISISQGCPVVIGVVESVNDKELKLTIQDMLSGSGNETGTVSLSLDQYRKDGIPRDGFSPWRDVKIEVGKQLLLAKCELNSESRGPGLVVSDQNLFVPIRNAIATERLVKQDPSMLMQISKSLSVERNLLYTGYIFSLLRGGAGDRDVEAISQSEILKNGGRYPRSGLALLRVSLLFKMELVGELSLTEQTRKTVLANLITGAINKKGSTKEIFTLLCRFVDQDEINIAQLLTPENRDKFNFSYQRFKTDESIECNGRRKFENQLNLK